MNDNTSYREKGRAVFLAAIMVLSVVAMSAAFAGGAAADVDGEDAAIEGGVSLSDSLEEDESITVQVTAHNESYDITETDTVELDEDSGTNPESYSIEDLAYNDSDGIDYDVSVEIIDYENTAEADFDDVSDESVTLTDDSTVTQDFTITYNSPTPASDINYDYAGSIAWQGQTVVAYGDDIDSNYDAGDDIELRQVDSFSDNDSTFERELTTRKAGDLADEISAISHSNEIIVTVSTDPLDNEYYFVNWEDSAGNSLADNFERSDSFEVSVQDLDVEFDDDEVTDVGESAETEVSIESNRGTFDLNVSADGDLEADELADIFGNNGEFTNVVEDDDEDRITLVGINADDYDISFDGIDTGEYDFDFEVDDTEAEASASITVSEHDSDGSFSQGVYTQSAGDYQEITLELEDTDEAWIQVGDENAGFVDIVYVKDDDANGEVSFWVNTRELGNPGVPGEAVYHTDDDDIESLFHDGHLSEGVTFWDDDEEPLDQGGQIANFEEYLDELGIIDASEDSYQDQLTRPLQPTDYSLTASDEGYFIVDDGESEADDELDQATLDLIEPEIGEINTYVAPAEDADDADLEELLTEVEMTPRTEVAEDDRLIIEVEATGLYGALGAASDERFSIMTDGASAEGLYELTQNSSSDNPWHAEGINFDVEADDAIGNQDPTFLDLDTDDDDEIYVLIDNENGAFYVVVDSGADVWDGGLDTPHEFDVDFEYETDDDERYRFVGGADVAYPYFGADSDESVSTSFDVVDPAVEFSNLDADDNVQIETSDSAVISGETNVAPGSDADIRIRNAGDTPSFLNTPGAEIDSDGSFESEEVDFSDRAEDDEATITFRVGGSSVDSASGIFVESVEETDDEPPEEDDEPPETDDEPPETDDEPPETDDDPAPPSDDDEPVDTEDDGVPGFGLAIAVVALLAAAMLALRRQN